jgi:putative Holliday junction resolvase
LTRLLGIDLGRSRIGLAIGDTTTGDVRPLVTLRRSAPERDAASISTLFAEQRIDEVVVGLPLMLDGSEGEQAAETRAWASEVIVQVGVPVVWRDERLTTEHAIGRVGRVRRGADGGPPSASANRAYRAKLDREAAALILQAELDERARQSTAR